jgi:Tol biopolymer transport system component/tRNA A-37 threonylcarbamoyl transferase component Bud32
MDEVLERLNAALAGRYAVERELGHGGMAVVYLAEDLKHHRRVALKILRPELAASVGSQRFLREIEIAATLTHPHILPLYDSGEADGLLYYVMPFVAGESLRDRLSRERRLPVADALAITTEAADALGHAHALGVIHRDIKPENILLEAGHAVVSDFGIARAVSAAGTSTLTETGLAVGTPAYMSPEQASGSKDVDARSDLYALGCVLYEMLTGDAPYAGPTPMAILAKKLSEPAPRVSVERSQVPAQVEAALVKVLAAEPADRFVTAADFAAALAGRPFEHLVTAETRRRRRRLAAIAAVAALAAAGAYLVLSGTLGDLGPRAPANATETHLTTDPGMETYPSLSPDGKWVVYAGDQAGNRDIFLRAVGGENPIDLTRDSPADDDQPAFSADGERIAFRSGREGGGIFVMGRTGEAVRRVTDRGFRPTWSPDGGELAFATEDVPLIPQNMFGTSELWVANVRTGALRPLDAGDAVLPSWSPHGHRIAFLKRLGSPTQEDIWTIPAQGGEPVAVTSDRFIDWNPAWSPDGRYLYFASNRGGSMNLWRVRIDERSGRTRGAPEPVKVSTPNLTQISVAAGGRAIAYSSVQYTINIQTAALDPTFTRVIGEPAWVTTGSGQWSSPDPSRDGRWVAFYALARGDIYVAHPDGSGLRRITGDSAGDRVPRWSPDGRRIAFFSERGGKIQLWTIRSDASDLRQVTDADGSGSIAVWSPDGARMAGSVVRAGMSGSAIFDPSRPWAQQEVQALPAPHTAMREFYINSWSPDGRRLCGGIGPKDAGILTYDLGTRRYERLTDFGEWPVWLPDSRHILFVSGGRAFYVVDSGTKQVRTVFTVSRDVIGPPRASADGRRIFYTRRVTEADLWLATLH